MHALHKLWRIQTKNYFIDSNHFKNDGSSFVLWDAAVVAISEIEAGKNLRNQLMTNGLGLIEYSCEQEEFKFRPDEIPERENAIQCELKEASYSLLLGSNSPDMLFWSSWMMTEKEYAAYHGPKALHVWALVVKSKMDPRCSIAFDGSNYLFSKMLVPADTREEAIAIVSAYWSNDFCEVSEVLRCSIYSEVDEVFDLYAFNNCAKDARHTHQHNKVFVLENAGDEYLEDIEARYRRRKSDQ